MPSVNVGDIIKPVDSGYIDRNFVVTELEPELGAAPMVNDSERKYIGFTGSIRGDFEIIGHMAVEDIVDSMNVNLGLDQAGQDHLHKLLEEQVALGPVEFPKP